MYRTGETSGRMDMGIFYVRGDSTGFRKKNVAVDYCSLLLYKLIRVTSFIGSKGFPCLSFQVRCKRIAEQNQANSITSNGAQNPRAQEIENSNIRPHWLANILGSTRDTQ